MLRWEVDINEMGVPRRWDAVIVYALAIRAASLNRRLFHFHPYDGCRRRVYTESVSTSPMSLALE